MGPSVTDDGFNRIPNPTILFCNMSNNTKVARVAFHNAIVKLASEANVDSKAYTVIGEDP